MPITYVRGSLKYESWMHNKIGVDQIYSPSGLYSILVHKDVIDDKEMFCLKEIFILNNNDFEVQQYKLVGGAEGDPTFENSEVLDVYWCTDTLLVCMEKENSNLVQRTFSVNHGSRSIHYIKSTTFSSSVDSEMFWMSDSCIVLNENSYIVYCNVDVERNMSVYIQLVPKNPFSEKKSRKYIVSLTNCSGHKEFKKTFFFENERLNYIIPGLANKNKLLCPIRIKRNGKSLAIFGVFLEINLDNLENINENTSTIDKILERQAKDVISIVYLPKPNDVSAIDFYTLQTIKEIQFKNFCVMEEKTDNNNIIRVVDFRTMHNVKMILPKDESPVFTMHPSGFMFQWFISENKIKFRKINISWKSENLEEVSRRTILYNPKIDYSHIEGMEQFLFPGAKFIQKEKPKKVLNDQIERNELNLWLTIVILSLLVALFSCSLFIF